MANMMKNGRGWKNYKHRPSGPKAGVSVSGPVKLAKSAKKPETANPKDAPLTFTIAETLKAD